MLTRALVGVALLALGAGCKGQLNAAYCAEHPDDGDCRDAGLVRIDAPKPECTFDDDCAGNPNGAVCDTAAHKCALCVDDVDETACTTQMMVCGVDQKCHGCIVDSDCASSSMVCLPTETCAEETGVLYTSPDGNGTLCTRAAPCALATAVQQLAPSRHIIKLTTTISGVDYAGPPIAIAAQFGVQLIGTGTTFTPNAAGDAITASGQNLEILGLTIRSAQGSGVACTAGLLTLRRMAITGSTSFGVSTQACGVTIERTRLSANVAGGLSITAGDVEVRNNILDRNGSDKLEEGNIRLRTVSGRVVFNTLALNLSRAGGGRTSGITCTAAGGGLVISRNILADNGPANEEITGDCTAVGNFLTANVDEVSFVNTTDFRLSAQSPQAAVLDDPDADAECKRGGNYIDDFQGEPRPVGFCDKGADEYRPLTATSQRSAPP
jgi:hypothetical protein